MEDKATPRPWRPEPQDNGDTSIMSCAPGDHRSLIADCPSLMDNGERDAFASANAALIVRAVNSYESYQALAKAAATFEKMATDGDWTTTELNEIREALAAVDAAEKA